MKKANTIVLLLLISFSLMSFSNINSKPKPIDISTVNNLKQYVGDYVHEAQDLTVRIYTKENDTRLYLSVPAQSPYELVSIGEHKFSFKVSEDYKVKFKNPKNGVFNELILIQPNGTFTAIRKKKARN